MTAAEAYPALERGFLDAKHEIWASFLIFDLATPLRSDRAKVIGQTWHDLVVHTLRRGITLNIVIGDADPVFHPALHRSATRQLRQLQEAGLAAGEGARLTAQSLRHPAQVNILGRLAGWPIVLTKLRRTCREMNRLPPAERQDLLPQLGDLSPLLRQSAAGQMRPRILHLARIFPIIHHQKLAVIDRRYLYIGGLDLDSRQIDPPAKSQGTDGSWHDIQLMLEGPVVAEAQLHLESFRDVIDGKMAPPKTRRLIRTLSLPRHRPLLHLGPEPVVTELRSAHLALTQRSKSFIYLETPRLDDRLFVRQLAECGGRNPRLSVILMLPAIPDDMEPDRQKGLCGRWRKALQDRALAHLRKRFGERIFIGSPGRQGTPPTAAAGPFPLLATADIRPKSMQARIAIFDDDAALVSSADLTMRSLSWDTEAGLYLANNNDVQELRYRVMTHWLPVGADQAGFHPQTAVQEWRRIALDNAARLPDLRDTCILTHETAVAEAMSRLSAGRGA